MAARLLTAILCGLPLLVYTRNAWVSVFVTGAMTGLLLLQLSQGHRRYPWGILVGGLSLLAYTLLQYLNTRASQVSLPTGWQIQAKPYLSYLPSSIATLNPSIILAACVVVGTLMTALIVVQWRRKEVYLLWTVLTVTAVCISLLGITQLVSDIGIYGLIDLPHDYQPFGTFLYKNHAVAFLNLTWILGMILLLRAREHQRIYWYWWAALLLITSGVLATNSRAGAIVQAGLWVLLWLFWGARSKHRAFRIFMGMALVSMAVVWWFHPGGVRLRQGETWDNQARTLVAKATLKMGNDFLPYGVGLGQFSYQFPRYQALDRRIRNTWWDENRWVFWEYAHCEWLQWFAELGYFGLAWLAFMGWYLWHTWGEVNTPCKAGLLGLSLWLVHTIVDFPLHNLAILMCYVSTLMGLWVLSQKTDYGKTQECRR